MLATGQENFGAPQLSELPRMTAFNHYNPDRPLIFNRRMSFLPERRVAPTYAIMFLWECLTTKHNL